MTPVSSNTASGCTATSSNCVVWQGPDLDCVNLCKGDTITDVVYKLATELCQIAAATSIDVSSLDFACLVEASQSNPTELTDALQLMIDKICALESNGGNGTGTGEDPLVRLPQCLVYTDNNGDIIEYLPHTAYSRKLADTICSLITSINTAESRLDQHNMRITALENAPAPTAAIPTVNVQCLAAPGSAMPITTAFTLLEDAYCDLSAVLGTPAQLLQGVNRECANLASTPRLSGTGNMSTIPGWVINPDTVAETLTNLWLTICDMRTQIVTLNGVTAATCNDVILDYQATLSANRSTLTYKTFGLSSIPSGFTVCPSTTANLVISDGTTTYTHTFNLTNNLVDSDGEDLNIVAFGLNPNNTITTTMNVCLTNGTITCSKTKTVSLPNNCVPVSVTNVVATPQSQAVNISWAVPAAPQAPTSYIVTLTRVSNNTVVGTQTVTTNVATFSSLQASTQYSVTVVAVYSCGNAPAVSATFTTTVCGSSTGTAVVDDDTSTTGETLTVNGVVITPTATTPAAVSAGCDGVYTIAYALGSGNNTRGDLLINGTVVDTLYEGQTALSDTYTYTQSGGTVTIVWRVRLIPTAPGGQV